MKKEDYLVLRIDKIVKAYLRIMAEKDGRTLSDYVNRILLEHIKPKSVVKE